jgi:hypothetical protein
MKVWKWQDVQTQEALRRVVTRVTEEARSPIGNQMGTYCVQNNELG